MSEKVLVHIEIDIWKSNTPKVRTEKVERETGKTVIIKRTYFKKWERTTPRVRESHVHRDTLDRIFSAAPGKKRYHLILEEQENLRTDPEYKHAVTAMMDEIYSELAIAEAHLAVMEEDLAEKDPQ